MVEKDLGFVLRRYNFRDTSLIVSLYTQRFGKIRGILKGFYTNKKEFSSPLDLFTLNEFIFYPKKSEIWLISYADLISNYEFLSRDLARAQVAATLIKLTDKIMQLWDSNHYIFDLITNCLKILEKEKPEKVLSIFIIKLLTYSGFKPEFNHCIICNRILNYKMLFSASKGGLVCSTCQRETKDAQKISTQASRSILYIQKEDFPLVCRLNLSSRSEAEIFNILRTFIDYHFELNNFIRYSKIAPKLMVNTF